MQSKLNTIIGGLIGIFISIFWLLVTVSIVIGIWHAFSKHSVLSGLASIFIPPYAVYMTYDAFYGHNDETKEPASIILHISSPLFGNTQIAMKSENAPPLDQCEAELDKIKNNIFKIFQKENPEFKNAVLTKAECVNTTKVEPKKIERTADFKEPIVSLLIRFEGKEKSAMIFYPAPTEGMSLDECKEFFKSEQQSQEWIKFAHNLLKGKNPFIFKNSQIIHTNCMIPTEKMLNQIQDQN